MDEILRWGAFAVLGALAVYMVKRNLSTVDAAGVQKLARLGLRPDPTAPKGGSTFVGQHGGFECGYTWGPTAKLLNRVRTRGGTFTAGSEFFAKLGWVPPPLAIVQRDDGAWRQFEGEVVPATEVLTGDATFDGRFSVRCADPEWAREVLGPPARSRLLGLPLVFLTLVEDQVVAALYFDGTRLFHDLGVSMSQAWSVMDRGSVFLDAAVTLAAHVNAARRS